MRFAVSLSICCLLLTIVSAEPAGDIRELKLRDWEPKSMMAVKPTIVERPLYPVIDMHNHLGGGKDRLKPEVVARYLKEMDEAGVRTVVNLDGGWGDRLKETLAAAPLMKPTMGGFWSHSP